MSERPKRSSSRVESAAVGITLIAAIGIGAGVLFHDNASAVTYSYRTAAAEDPTLYSTYGLAIGGRWKTHEVFAPTLRQALEEDQAQYRAYPFDNVIADIKTRGTDEPLFARSVIVEIGPLSARYEGRKQHIQSVGQTIFEQHSTFDKTEDS